MLICKTCKTFADLTNPKEYPEVYKWLKKEFKKAHRGHKVKI